MFPDQSQGERKRDDRRNDDHNRAVQYTESQDDHQQHRHQQRAKGDGVGRDGHCPQPIDAHYDLVAGQQGGDEDQDAVGGRHFHS